MKIILDQDALRRRARLSHAASLGGLLLILASVAISLWKPNATLLTSILLVVGFAVSVIGIYYANRWVKKPRPEQVLNNALKGLSDKHRLYHYALPCDHVLLMPNGLVVIETVNLEGHFTYRDGKWRQKITPGRAMRFFVEEKLGNPIQRARDCADHLKGLLQDELPADTNLTVHPILVFTHPMVDLHLENPEIAVCQPKSLRSRIPKKLTRLEPEVYQAIQSRLDQIASQS